MELQLQDSVLIVGGVACIMAAAVGGGLKAFGVEIPVLQQRERQLFVGFVGAGLLGLGLFLTRGNVPSTGSSDREASLDSYVGNYMSADGFQEIHVARHGHGLSASATNQIPLGELLSYTLDSAVVKGDTLLFMKIEKIAGTSRNGEAPSYPYGIVIDSHNRPNLLWWYSPKKRASIPLRRDQ